MTTVELPCNSLPRRPALDEGWSKYLNAYDIILDAERHADEHANTLGWEGKVHLMFARAAGRFLIELFNRCGILESEEPCSKLATEVESSSQTGGIAHDVVFAVGKRYYDYFLRTYRTSTRKYSTPSLHPSRPFFDTLQEMTNGCMEADGKDYQTFRRKALARDGFRCMVTRSYNTNSVRDNAELARGCFEQDCVITAVQACHILSESTMQHVDSTWSSGITTVEDKTNYAATAMSVLVCFGFTSIAGELLAEVGVHNLGNLLSLETEVPNKFDNLDLWFEGTDEPNRYKLCASNKGHAAFLRRSIGNRQHATFTSNHPKARLPNPKLLALHAACARVAHMSGATEVIDELERDAEATRVLTSDGSSARLLDHLMTPFATVPGVA